MNSPTELGPLSHRDALAASVGPVAGLAIADIGCGEGALDRALASQGAVVTGYDPFMAPTERVTAGAGSWQIQRAAADAIPAPDASFDLVLFVFSLHHVPQKKLAGALAEARRLLRPAGRLYVAEPLARGPHQYIVELFHDETAVRAAAAEALARFATPHFADSRVLTYVDVRRYGDFDDFAARMIANRRFNGYTEAAVLAPAVRRRFEETMAEARGAFDQPVRINLFA
ncbi:MAG TPA: class I SAM-dependent methyltransferase [Stellaceae bacterium]|nr:class I SAM-dependent methyltransferase [Stellaceae bacterium]